MEENQNGAEKAALSQKLDTIKEQLMQLKTKSSDIISEEVEVSDTIKKRCQHLKNGCVENGGREDLEMKAWRKTRLDRMMVEYLLRQGYYDSALQLAENSKVTHLSNTEVFFTAREVEDSLVREELDKVLAWCHDNKSRLRKLKSSLEFQVRLQEYLELVKKGQKLDAVKHAKKFLFFPETESEHISVVQQAMGLLAFPITTVIQPYKDLLDASRWQTLIHQFRQENFRLHQLSSQCMFTVALQSGLAALKTPQCYRNNFVLTGLSSLGQITDTQGLPLPLMVGSGVSEKNPECPVCDPHLNTIAQNLPFAHCSQSRLVCTISGTALNENNQPMMLPNGHVYGERALEAQARQNEGSVICPRTKEIYSFKDAEKVYIM